MGVVYPDLLIGKLWAICTLRIDTVIVLDDLASLHHESWNDSLEDSRFVMNVHPKLSRAQKTEIFTSFGKLLLEELHDYSLLLVALLAFSANLNIHENLDVVHAKSWHLAINLRLIVCILTVHENFCSRHFSFFIIGAQCIINFRLKLLPMLSQGLAFLSLHSMLAIIECLRVVLDMHIS